jgi:hypothetical protein
MNPLCLSHRLTFPLGHLAQEVVKEVIETKDYLSAVGQLRAKDIHYTSLAEVVNILVEEGLASRHDFTQLMNDSLLVTHSNVIQRVISVLGEIESRYPMDNIDIGWDFCRKTITIKTMPDAYILAPASSPIGQLQRHIISLVDGIFCVSDKDIIYSGLRGQIISEVEAMIQQENFTPIMALSSIAEAFCGDVRLEDLDEDERIDIVSFAIDEFLLDINYDDSLEIIGESLVSEIKSIIGLSRSSSVPLEAFESMDFGEHYALGSKLIDFAREFQAHSDRLNQVAQKLMNITYDAQSFCYGVYFVSEGLVDLAEKDINYIYETGETCALECSFSSSELSDLDYFFGLYRSFLSLFIDE